MADTPRTLPRLPAPVDPGTLLTEDPWQELKGFTAARIALGRAGVGLPTREVLSFRLAHARARDAVTLPLDLAAVIETLARLGLSPVVCSSRAEDRQTFLTRPDLGRRLTPGSVKLLAAAAAPEGKPFDLALAFSEGLSAPAIETNLAPFLAAFLPLAQAQGLSLAPLTYVSQGRVAVGDDVGHALRARAVAMLVGERPGLSSPDSLGVYYTFDPKPGLTDERRNCISNVRDGGLPPSEGARKLAYLVRQSLRLGLSGVALKDEEEDVQVAAGEEKKPEIGEE